MDFILDDKVLKRVRQVLGHYNGADGVYEFSLDDNSDTPRAVVSSDRNALLYPTHSIQYGEKDDKKIFYIGFPRE